MITEPPKWVAIAEGELGQAEIPGYDANKRILEYFKSTWLHSSSDETPWCAAFVGWCLLSAGEKPTKSAAARSYASWGKSLKTPEFGCIVVLRRGGGTWQGHVGFYVGESTPETIRILGGNQGDKVSIQNFKKSDVIAYRWPNKN